MSCFASRKVPRSKLEPTAPCSKTPACNRRCARRRVRDRVAEHAGGRGDELAELHVGGAEGLEGEPQRARDRLARPWAPEDTAHDDPAQVADRAAHGRDGAVAKRTAVRLREGQRDEGREAITAEAARTHFRSAGSPGIVQPMRCQVLACDYDGTLASDRRIAPQTMRALGRVRDSGRRIVLVTGRQLDDLLGACPGIDFFDWVVAENGAVLYEPRGKRVDDLAAPPPAACLAALERAGVPFSTGRVVVATVVPHQTAVRRAIHD